MKKKSQSRSLLTVAMVSAILSGCDNEDYRAEDCHWDSAVEGEVSCGSPNNAGGLEPPDATEYVEKSGVTGQVLGADYWQGATLCFDNNRNGVCDESEPIERSFEDGKYSFDAAAIEASISSNAPLLAVKTEQPDQTTALYAPTPASSSSKGVNVTVFTTFVMNEMVFNPYTLNSPEQARTAFQIGSFVIGNEAVLLGQDYITAGSTDINQQASDIAESFSQAQLLNAGQHYKAVAAVTDAMYQQRVYKTTIDQAAIAAQTINEQGFNAALSSPAIKWGLGHEEEASTDLHVQGNYAVVGSQYHNRLIVLDLTTNDPVLLSRNDFAASPNVERDEIDAITGASEQVLSEVSIIPGGQSVLVGVEKKKKTSSEMSAGLGVGLYRADFSDPGAIPMTRFAADSGSQNFYPFPGLNEMAVSANASSVVLSGEDKKLTVLSTSDFSAIREFSFASKVRAVALDEAGTTVYASLFGARIGLVILDVASGNELAFFAVAGTNYPQNIHVFDGQSKIAWYLRGDKVLSVYSISNPPAGPVLMGQISATDTIKSFDISADGTLVMIAINGGGLELHALGTIGNEGSAEAQRLIASYQVEDNTPINKVIFETDTRALVSIKNGLQILDIEIGLPASEWDDGQKNAWLLQHRTP